MSYQYDGYLSGRRYPGNPQHQISNESDRICRFRRQGVLTCGLIIADIAATQGIKVTRVPPYGSAMRSGTANCTVNFICNPAQEQPNFLLPMNGPSFDKFLPMVAHGKTVLVGDTVEIPENARKDVSYVRVNAMAISTELSNHKGANIVMPGAIVNLMGDFSRKGATTAMNYMFEKKGKGCFNEANAKAFDAGYTAVSYFTRQRNGKC